MRVGHRQALLSAHFLHHFRRGVVPRAAVGCSHTLLPQGEPRRVVLDFLALASARVCRIVLFCVSCEQNRPSNLDEMMASVKVPGRK